MRRQNVLPRYVLVTAIALAASVTAVSAQARAQQRAARQGPPDARAGQVLLDRVAQRVGRALRLDAARTRRLRDELQASREARARIAGEAREVRQELQRLVQQTSPDEQRIGELLDQVVGLEVAAAQVAVDEQRRLADFLTPIQRARFLWVRQRLAQEALRQLDTLPGGGPLRPR